MKKVLIDRRVWYGRLPVRAKELSDNKVEADLDGINFAALSTTSGRPMTIKEAENFLQSGDLEGIQMENNIDESKEQPKWDTLSF
jgi:hypothetical protein